MRLLILMLLFTVLLAPMPTQAQARSCDPMLYLAGIGKAHLDPTPPPWMALTQLWEYQEGQFKVIYFFAPGVTGFSYILTVYKHGVMQGRAENWNWTYCAPSNAWKRWIAS